MTTKLNFNANEAIANAVIARANAIREEKRANSYSKDAQTAINAASLPDNLEKGLLVLSRITETNPADLVSFLSINDKKAAHYLPIKAVVKVIDLIRFFSGAELKDNFTALMVTSIMENVTRGKYGILNNAVTGAELTQKGLRTAIGYQAAEYPDEMDELISRGGADYGITTISTQASQLKSVFLALGLASGVKYTSKFAVQFSNKFVRELIANRDRIKTRNTSRGWYNPEKCIF